MNDFQNLLEEVRHLEIKINDQFKLLEALANFHVDDDVENMINQRTQITTSVREIEANFGKIVDLWQKLSSELKARVAYEPDKDSHAELISKFMKMVVPIEMQSTWRDNHFSGSLLVFFENGKIASSSLIEKRLRTETDEISNNQITKSENNDFRKFNNIDLNHKDSFTILKSPHDSKLNIYFSLKEPTNVKVKIFNQMDKIVRRFENRYNRPGEYAIEWDGCNDEGDSLAKENYYCQLQIGDEVSEIKSIDLS